MEDKIKKIKNGSKAKRKGMVLVIAMVIMSMLLIVGFEMLTMVSNTRIRAVRNTQMISAGLAADAGAADAMKVLKDKLADEGPAWDTGDFPKSVGPVSLGCAYGNASYRYQITGSFSGGYQIEATGVSGVFTRKVYSSIRAVGIFEYGILVNDFIGAQNNNIFKGWDSSNPGINHNEVFFNMGTLSIDDDSMTFGNGSEIFGNVFVGIGGEPDDVIDGCTIHGTTYSLTETIKTLTISAPSIYSPGGTLSVPKNGTVSITSDKMYNGITFSNGGKILIEGGNNVVLYIVNDIDMNANNCEIKVQNDGSSLELYLGGDLIAKNNSGFNNITTQFPERLKIFTVGSGIQTIQFKNNGDFYAAIYAPNAAVEFNNNGNVYGSITANSITTKNNLNFYYDQALRIVDVSQVTDFKVSRWRQE